ncbi:MAG TPA: diguanylate cyclase [Deltaproteobacteria bacterium]|jgi:diguanylate cyclase (GGDEF)-like protein/PAS domain S-box-containing protein|nr:diguanylate cyclase [Deltaproteobacteria bacterium]
MDLDIERLEDILSPYFFLKKRKDVVYVSNALALKTGFLKEDIQNFLDTNTSIFCSQGGGGQVVTLPTKGKEAFDCTFTNTRLGDNEIFSFSEKGKSDANRYDQIIPEILLLIMSSYSTGSCLIAEKGHIIHANNTFLSLLGFPISEIIGMQVIEIVSGQSRESFIKGCEDALKAPGRMMPPMELMLTSSSGRQIFVSVIGGWVTCEDRDYLWLMMNDMTETINLMRRLSEEHRRFSELYNLSPIGMLYVNPRGKILDCNDFVSKLTGYSKDEIFGSSFTKFVDPHEEERLREDFWRLFTQSGSIHRHECMLRTKSGESITIEYDVQVITRKNRNIQALMVFSDVTDKRELEIELLEKNAEMEKTLWEMAEVKDALEARAGELNRATEELKVLNEKLSQLSITDGLTEIYNHRHFQDRLSEEVERFHRAKDGVLSLLVIDIDDFKHFNDTYGHQCGDIVLKQLAGILRSNVRSMDILARYGGEEFAVILPNAKAEEAAKVGERICESVRSTPFSFGDGTSVKVTVSIGVGTLTHGQGEKSDLIKKADSALYAAKAKWKDRVEIWEED